MMDGRRSPRETIPIGSRPDAIAARRFSLAVLGVHPGQVRGSLLEIGAALDRTRTALTHETLEVSALGRALDTATAAIQKLRAELRAVQAEVDTRGDHRPPAAAQFAAAEASTRMVLGAKAQADEIAAAAEQTAKATTQAARVLALEVLRSARAAAEAARRAADLAGELCAAGPRFDANPRTTGAGAIPKSLPPGLVALCQELESALRRTLSRRDDGAPTAAGLDEASAAVRAMRSRTCDLITRCARLRRRLLAGERISAAHPDAGREVLR